MHISWRASPDLALSEFPFPERIHKDKYTSYKVISKVAIKYLKKKAKIFDFGCGACDKLAVLSHLGFECTGLDDLSDNWHKLEGNKDRIMSYAKKSNLNLVVEDVFKFIEKDSNLYDMVMLHDVFEHMHNSPSKLLISLLKNKQKWIAFYYGPKCCQYKKKDQYSIW